MASQPQSGSRKYQQSVSTLHGKLLSKVSAELEPYRLGEDPRARSRISPNMEPAAGLWKIREVNRSQLLRPAIHLASRLATMSLKWISPSLAPLSSATPRDERRDASIRFKALLRLASAAIVPVARVLPGFISLRTGTRSRSRNCKASPPKKSRTKSSAGASRIEAGAPPGSGGRCSSPPCRWRAANLRPCHA